ncbi:MAG: radical SAM protein [Candidatus Brocadia sp.]|nr:radical SAM protein [Candidatus Brocadia sp.]
MRIALFNTVGLISCDGAHLISALLKRGGHSVKNILLARRGKGIRHEPDEIDLLHEILKDCDLVMFAVYTSFVVRAIQITEFVHKKYPGMKVIWGGPHCISAPELSLKYADGVCFAEGDVAIVDLVNKMESGADYLNTPNMAFKVNGLYKKNNILPPLHDMDSLPYYDYDLDNQFIFGREILPMTGENCRENYTTYPFSSPTFHIITSRGCPYQCTYCANVRHISLYGHIPIRFMSVNRVICELEYTIKRLGFIQQASFSDDDFLLRDNKQLEDFSKQYKEKIDLPFSCCVSANTFRKEKLEILLDAGLKIIELGVQSGSQRVVDEVFKRKIKVSKTKEILQQVEPYFRRYDLKVLLDFIIDNPYETKDDIIQTYQYIIDVPPGSVEVNMFFLVFFPGSPIYERAIKDGIINETSFEKTGRSYVVKSHVQYQKNYETALVVLALLLNRRLRLQRYFPRFVLRTLGSRPVRKIASLLPSKFYMVIIKGCRPLIHQNGRHLLLLWRSLKIIFREIVRGANSSENG